MKKEIPDLSVLLTKEQGKPLGDSQREIEHFLHGMNFYAGLASKIRGSYVPLPDNKMYGMVLASSPSVFAARLFPGISRSRSWARKWVQHLLLDARL